jgi:hypothetical protein
MLVRAWRGDVFGVKAQLKTQAKYKRIKTAGVEKRTRPQRDKGWNWKNEILNTG